MKGTKQIIACKECTTFWDEGRAPRCADDTHPKTEHRLHVHEDAVTLLGDIVVIAASHDDEYDRDQLPDFGLYLDARWSPPWPHDHVDWPDFGLPADQARFRTQLADLLDRARSGQRVEIGCLGGHGRTGTALACAAILAGHDPSTATSFVRQTYCEHAVETREQDDFVSTFPPLDDK